MAVGNERRIGNMTAGMMVALALLVDFLQVFCIFLNIIPGLGVIVGFYVTIIATCIFGIWFGICRVSYLSGKKAGPKALTALSSIFVELVPFISALPMTTVSVGTIIWLSRKEDEETSAEAARNNAQAAAMQATQRTALRQTMVRRNQEASTTQEQEAA